MDIHALPFYRMEKRVEKRKPKGYSENPQTIGEHIRKKRIDEGLLQKELATLFGTSVDTITNWENNKYFPQIQFAAKIIAFLCHNALKQDSVIGPRRQVQF